MEGCAEIVLSANQNAENEHQQTHTTQVRKYLFFKLLVFG